jgi:hypothetical protein
LNEHVCALGLSKLYNCFDDVDVITLREAICRHYDLAQGIRLEELESLEVFVGPVDGMVGANTEAAIDVV